MYLARDEELGRELAVKVLRSVLGPEMQERFRREAVVTSRLRHPHVVEVYDLGVTAAGAPWIAYQLVEGQPLGAVAEDPARRSDLPVLGAQVASALQAAHDLGVIHRDVKPDNVLVREGAAILLDFGIAFTGTTERLTATGLLFGTPAFMAPETLHGLPPGPAADQWALAATLWRCATGRPVYGGTTPPEVLDALRDGGWPRPGGRDLEPGFERVLRRALAPEPEARFDSCRAFEQALLGLRPLTPAPGVALPEDPRPRPWWLPAAFVGLLAIGALLPGSFPAPRPPEPAVATPPAAAADPEPETRAGSRLLEEWGDAFGRALEASGVAAPDDPLQALPPGTRLRLDHSGLVERIDALIRSHTLLHSGSGISAATRARSSWALTRYFRFLRRTARRELSRDVFQLDWSDRTTELDTWIGVERILAGAWRQNHRHARWDPVLTLLWLSVREGRVAPERAGALAGCLVPPGPDIDPNHWALIGAEFQALWRRGDLFAIPAPVRAGWLARRHAQARAARDLAQEGAWARVARLEAARLATLYWQEAGITRGEPPTTWRRAAELLEEAATWPRGDPPDPAFPLGHPRVWCRDLTQDAATDRPPEVRAAAAALAAACARFLAEDEPPPR